MKHLLKAAACVAALASFSTHASTFDFSYTFTDGQALTGSLNGTLNGSLVTDISNISVAFDGVQLTGPLFAGSFDPTNGVYNFGPNAAVVSTSAAQNNFIFADTTDPTGVTQSNWFYFVNAAQTPAGSGTSEAFLANSNVLTNSGDFDGPTLGQWSLTPAPVPLPAALPLLVSGLGMFAAAKRRRLQVKAA